MAVTASDPVWSANANAFETDATEAVSFAGAHATGRAYVGIMVSATNKTISSVTDDGGNSYALVAQGGTNATTENTTSVMECWIYAATITSSMQTVTVVINSALATGARVALLHVADQHATTPDEDVSIFNTNGVNPAVSVTTANAGNVLFGVMAASNGTYSSAGFTAIGTTTNFHAVYRSVDAATTTWTVDSATASEQPAMALVAIQPVAAGGINLGVVNHHMRQQGIS